MADQHGYAEVAGLPFKVTPEQQQQLAGSGQYQPVSQEMAQGGAQALADIQKAQQDYGDVGAAGMGAFSGLTLGLGPGVAAALGFLDPNSLSALQETGAYTAGDIAGTVAPAIFSGGESLGLRGLMGSALRATPAGLMNLAGSASERLAGRLLPGLGRLGAPAVKMAARGAVEGGLINLGHTVGDSLIQNKPLSAEALWASGVDGALAGGLMGGGLGLVGGMGQAITERLPSTLGGAAKGTSEKGLGITARRIGMTEGEVAAAKEAGGLGETLKNYRSVLDKEGSGVTYSSGTGAIREAAGRAGGVAEKVRSSVVDALDKEASLAVPRVERLAGAIQKEVVDPVRAVPILGQQAEGFARKLTSAMERIEPELIKGSGMREAGSWKHWIAARDALADGIEKGTYSGVNQKFAQDTLRVLDQEIHSAMEAAGEKIGQPDLAKNFWGANSDLKYAKELQKTVGRKEAAEILAHESTFTPRDIGVMGAMGIGLGKPGLALGWATAKAVGRRLNGWAEPALAEMAFQRSIGARAAAAEQTAKFRIRESVRNFFSNAGKTAQKGYSVKRAEDRGRSVSHYSRADFEKAVSRAEALVSGGHQQRVADLLQGLIQNNYGELAKSIGETNQRAVEYLQANMPPRRAAKALLQLRAEPKIHGMDMKEFKFIRQHTGVTDPFALLDKLENGALSRDEVRAMKYVYPELHSQIVYSAMEHIQEMKASGGHLPMDKIVNLGLILDAPIDSMLDSSRVSAIQASFIPAAPPQDQQQPPQQAQPFTAQTLQTPVDALT